MENARRELARDLNLRDAGESLMQTPAFFARLNQNEVKALLLSERVVTVDKINPNAHAEFSAPADYTVGGEIIPWGKQAIGTDDSQTASNIFYIIDGAYDRTTKTDEELNVIHTNTTGWWGGISHPTSILALATAKNNGKRIRGINPGQPSIHRMANISDEDDVIKQITHVYTLAESTGQFSTLNLSFNSSFYGANDKAGRFIRRASARFFVVESAGNDDINACERSYRPSEGVAQPDDGIMVVGGTDPNGARYPFTQNPFPYNNLRDKRSNYGPCVDIWAPGQLMQAMLYDGETVIATGTSFAAPLVAAVSGRYGSNWHPIQREAQIRQSARFTGHHEGAPDSNLPIIQVHYSPNVIASTPKLLPIYGIYSETHTANLHTLNNSKFYEDSFWNAHGHYGTIVLDLGSPQNLKGVRLMIRSSAEGGVLNFAVHGANQITHTGPGQARIGRNVIGTKLTNDQFDLVPYYIPVSGRYRYISIDAANLNSWVAFSEIEVYGQ